MVATAVTGNNVKTLDEENEVGKKRRARSTSSPPALVTEDATEEDNSAADQDAKSNNANTAEVNASLIPPTVTVSSSSVPAGTVSTNTTDSTTAMNVPISSANASTEEEERESAELTESDNEAMTDVMAKMKEASDQSAAAQFAVGAQTAQITAPAGPPGSGKRLQLYESKRMSRVSFNSWFEFDSYFEMYMQDTFQPFRMRSSCSVEAYRRNQQKVMMSNKNSRGRRIEFPDSAIHHHRIYMCTHAMKARCRGATTRPGQKYRGIGCIAKINVKISPSDNPNKYMVIVTDQVVTHNHPISREIYEAYPDVLLKTMRRNQMTASMLTRQPSPKFESPSQSQKYERAMQALNSVAESMARMGDDEFEVQLAQLQKIYGNSVGAVSENMLV